MAINFNARHTPLEAETSKNYVKALSKQDRDNLISFLNS